MSDKQMGRPPKPENERRTNSIRVPLTDGERAIIDGAAATADERSVTWARNALLRAAKARLRKR